MATDLGKTLVLNSWNQSMGWVGKDLKSHLDPWAGESPRLLRAPELLHLSVRFQCPPHDTTAKTGV